MTPVPGSRLLSKASFVGENLHWLSRGTSNTKSARLHCQTGIRTHIDNDTRINRQYRTTLHLYIIFNHIRGTIQAPARID